MNRRQALGTLGSSAIGAMLAGGCSSAATASQPNILYIMSDDHATNAISAYGSRLSSVLPTPNIDRLAAEGVKLNNCLCTNSICTPSRACILTGQYNHINGVYTLHDTLDPDRANVAKELQQQGYETAMIGKWHLKSNPTGFDYWKVLPGQGLYHNPIFKEKGKHTGAAIKDGKGQQYEGYCTDVIMDLTLDWLKNREGEKPFFLMCHNKAPHGKWEYAERHADLFKDIDIPEPASLWEDKSHRSISTRDRGTGMYQLGQRMGGVIDPRPWPTGKLDITGMDEAEIKRVAYQKYLKEYLRCVAAVDENVGRLLDYLDETGLSENTLVIYTSDQGMFLGEHEYYDKRWIYEESMKMPFLARLPGKIEAGSTSDALVSNVDFAPTFLDYAGAATPDYMQGHSAKQVLSGDTPDDWQQSVYYRYWMHMTSHENVAHYGVRTEQYKLIFFYGLPLDAAGAVQVVAEPGWELYDLAKDPKELHNVYDDAAYSAVVKDLKAELIRLKDEVGDEDEKYPEMMQLREQSW
jgi:arylsulfatase A-like enzyme